ncbi:MAG: hypothetical protein HUU22_19415 [Phycisphaerae bacterium]|nr:hypothetical protein [Phycisphaerae bacterium]
MAAQKKKRFHAAGTSNDRPYYYVQDRLYNVWAMIDRAGAILEGWCGHPARGCSDATCDAGILPARVPMRHVMQASCLLMLRCDVWCRHPACGRPAAGPRVGGAGRHE